MKIQLDFDKKELIILDDKLSLNEIQKIIKQFNLDDSWKLIPNVITVKENVYYPTNPTNPTIIEPLTNPCAPVQPITPNSPPFYVTCNSNTANKTAILDNIIKTY